MSTNTEQAAGQASATAREVPSGTRVIYADGSGVFIYNGRSDDDRFA
jgi:hypothetical protein